MVKAPNFWFKPRSWQGALLKPLAHLYDWGGRQYRKGVNSCSLPVPIICVGNVVMGGGGKTPTVIKLTQILKNFGINVHIVSKGYGRKSKELLKVDPLAHSALDVGDEPLTLSSYAPTWVSKDRFKSCQTAIQNGAQLIIFDDGFQNPNIYKDLSILVVDSQQGLGNGEIFPAGPLRESWDKATSRADVILSLNGPISLKTGKAFVWKGAFRPLEKEPLAKLPVVAFCGIGFPEKFRTSLLQKGYVLKDFIVFPDHYFYEPKDIERLLYRAQGNPLITTEKDAVRLSPSVRSSVLVEKIELILENEEAIQDFLKKRFCLLY